MRSLVIDEDNGGNAKTETGALSVFLWKIAYVTQNVAVLTFIYMEYGFCVEASHPWGGGQQDHAKDIHDQDRWTNDLQQEG